ncbi:MAG: PrsW family intramembrane metalloprotease [Gammaproteobacteria bacterium]
MTAELALRASVGLLPVVCFLAAMRLFDSYKLVHLKPTLAMIAAGALGAVACYWIGAAVIGGFDLEFRPYSRYIAPPVEELLKGAIIVWLVARHRVAFPVDAAISGFAVGAGFAMLENLFYLRLLPDAPIGVWIVRGFGTAIMHGGTTAMFGILGLLLSERAGRHGARSFLPGLLLAAAIHSAYNHFFFSPVLAAVGILLVLPPLALAVFARSEASLEKWLESGFDADTHLLGLINSGRFSGSRVGRYLETLRARFDGPVVADMLCYLRTRTELALRAKGMLMARESGFDTAPDDATRARFAELQYLEKSIGPTGLLAIKPFMHMSRKDLWQLYQIGH